MGNTWRVPSGLVCWVACCVRPAHWHTLSGTVAIPKKCKLSVPRLLFTPWYDLCNHTCNHLVADVYTSKLESASECSVCRRGTIWQKYKPKMMDNTGEKKDKGGRWAPELREHIKRRADQEKSAATCCKDLHEQHRHVVGPRKTEWMWKLAGTDIKFPAWLILPYFSHFT